MSEKLKILVVTPPVPPDGSAPWTQNLLDGRYESVELHLVSTDPAEGNPGLLSTFGRIRQINAARKRLQPQALYFCPSGADPQSLLHDSLLLWGVRRKFPKTILHFHNTGLTEGSAALSGLRKSLFHRGFDRPDMVITNCQDGMRDTAFLKASHPVLVPEGLADVWSDGPRRDTFTPPCLLFLDTVSAEKGVGVLIEACQILHSRGHQFRCKIAGSAPSEGILAGFKKQAADSGAAIQFVGPVTGEKKWDLFAESDIFCLPPHDPAEPFGLGALEAMMSGLPVVATNWRSLPEIVAEGKSGFLTPVNDPKTLADKLARLLRDSILRQVMGTSARNRYLDHFRVDVFQHRMEGALDLIKEL